jgi:hypothetical protein
LLEQCVGVPLLHTPNLFSDGSIHREGPQNVTHFDIMITNPASKATVSQNRNYLYKNSLRPAKNCETAKINKYVKSYGENIRPHFHPFCLESTGAFGPIASMIIKNLGINDTIRRTPADIVEARAWFLKHVSVICARSRAALISHARSTVNQDILPPSDTILSQVPNLFNSQFLEQNPAINITNNLPSSSFSALLSVI